MLAWRLCRALGDAATGACQAVLSPGQFALAVCWGPGGTLKNNACQSLRPAGELTETRNFSFFCLLCAVHMVIASAAAVASSSREQLDRGIPVKSATMVWKFSSDSSLQQTALPCQCSQPYCLLHWMAVPGTLGDGGPALRRSAHGWPRWMAASTTVMSCLS